MLLLVIVPMLVAVGMTTMVTVAVPPTANVPSEQTTVAVIVQVPCVAVADTKVTPAGSVSVSVTPVAGLGPLLLVTIN